METVTLPRRDVAFIVHALETKLAKLQTKPDNALWIARAERATRLIEAVKEQTGVLSTAD